MKQTTYTAIVRKDKEVHVVKVRILDKTHCIIQMLNKTKGIITPQFKIKANLGKLYFGKSSSFYNKELQESDKLTENINRQSLVGYFNQFYLKMLVSCL